MFEYIKGYFIGMVKDYIIVENNGVGYKVHTSGSTMAQLPKHGEEISIYLEQIVREDFIGLYGFITKEEREMFNLLLTINGVGAKAALSLLSISSVDNLNYGISMGDEKLLTRAPGVGKKIAQRIILELKDKIKVIGKNAENENINVSLSLENNNYSDASEALLSLGFTEKEIVTVLKSINITDTVENIIKNSLKILMN